MCGWPGSADDESLYVCAGWLTVCSTCAQTWAFIERSAGDQERAGKLMLASTELKGVRPSALECAARFFTDVKAPGAKRAARKLYERALQRDPDHAPSLQVTHVPLCP